MRTGPSEAGIDRFEVVVVPFPFTDRAAEKRRPALVLSRAESFNRAAAHSAMAMITSAGGAPWPLDVPLTDLDAAGLPSPSFVRMKLFTLDHRLVLRRAGRLSTSDAAAVESSLTALLGTRAATKAKA